MRPETTIQRGITYRIDKNQFFYDQVYPEDDHYPYRGLIWLALASAAMGIVIGIGWCVFRIIEILVS